MSEIRTIKQATDRLRELGVKGNHVFNSLAAAKAALAKVEARRAGKPAMQSAAKPVAAAVASRPAVSPREALLSAIEAEQSPGKKADLYGKLSASLLDEMKNEKDSVKNTELARAYQRSEKNRGYCLHAESQLDPKAAKARKLMRFVD
jgi:hypothetical protein